MKKIKSKVCIRCGSKKVWGHGKLDGRQRYLCGNCDRTFVMNPILRRKISESTLQRLKKAVLNNIKIEVAQEANNAAMTVNAIYYHIRRIKKGKY